MIEKCEAMKVIVREENEEQMTESNKVVVFPRLKSIELERLPNLAGFFLGKKDFEWPLLNFVLIKDCSQMKVFTSGESRAPQLNYIQRCDGMKVVSSRDDEDHVEMINTTTFFPHLQSLHLSSLNNLKRIGGGGGGGKSSTNATTCDINDKFSQAGVASWSLYQYAREIDISECPSMVDVFETREINSIGYNSCTSDIDQGSTHTTLAIPRSKDITTHKLSNLKILKISCCDRLEFIFTSSSLESLSQLETLTIERCQAMKVIVREENEEQITGSNKVVVFPRLKSIQLKHLPNLAGFFLGKNEFEWPLLNFFLIDDCSQMKVFTFGESRAPKLNYIHTRLGKHDLECGLSFHEATTLHQPSQKPSLSLDSSSSSLAISQKTPWSFHNLIEMNMNYKFSSAPAIPSTALLQLQKLEKIHLDFCYTEVVFEVTGLEVANHGSNESKTVVKFPKLREVTLKDLRYLEHIWKSNRFIILDFPNLTTLSIDKCKSLKYVLTCSMVSSLVQLQELRINRCKNIEVIVKEEEEEEQCDAKESDQLKLPYLNTIQLEDLPSMRGFCLGNEDFLLPSLTNLVIKECPELEIFTKGHLVVPELKSAMTSLGSIIEVEDINSFIIKHKHEEYFRTIENSDLSDSD